MDAVFRAVAIYLFLVVLFRISGKRTMAQVTTFDLVLLLIISEAIQNAMTDTNQSFTHGLILIITLVMMDVGLSIWKQRSKRMEKLIDGVPLIIVENGNPLQDRMDHERVGEDDILSAARMLHGLERMDQIKYAVLEKGGQISVIPKEGLGS